MNPQALNSFQSERIALDLSLLPFEYEESQSHQSKDDKYEDYWTYEVENSIRILRRNKYHSKRAKRIPRREEWENRALRREK